MVFNSVLSHLQIGTVLRSKDTSRTGQLIIKPDTEDGQVGLDEIPCDMAGPALGGGYGFVHIPGPGARVLFTNLRDVGIEESPNKHVWFAGVAFPLLQAENMNVLGNDIQDPSDYYAASIDLHPSQNPLTDGSETYDAGLPNVTSIYGDNDLPQAAVWKAPPGHFLQFSNKVSKFGTHDVATLLMNASGKYIKLDDGPPTEGMDRITISDEMWEHGGNRIEILTGDPVKPNSIYVQSKQDQDYISVEGSQIMAVSKGEGSQIRENMATGGIHDIAYTADHSIKAETDISRTSETGDITDTAKKGKITLQADSQSIDIEAFQSISLTCGTSMITMTPTSITISADTLYTCGRLLGDSIRGPIGTSLMAHEHVSPFFLLPTLGHPYPGTNVPCV